VSSFFPPGEDVIETLMVTSCSPFRNVPCQIFIDHECHGMMSSQMRPAKVAYARNWQDRISASVQLLLALPIREVHAVANLGGTL
jgi:hypothetical protein